MLSVSYTCLQVAHLTASSDSLKFMYSIYQWNMSPYIPGAPDTLSCMLARDSVQMQMILRMTEIALLTNMQYVMLLKGHAVTEV